MKPEIELTEHLKQNSITTVEVAVSDLTGALRGKRVPVDAFFGLAAHGELAFSAAMFGWDYEAALLPDEELNWESGYGDFFARPDLSTLRLLPWRPGSALVLCDAVDEAGAPLEMAPRQILKRAVARASAASLAPKLGLEAEFYVLDPVTRRPTSGRNPVYSLHDDSHLAPMLEEIRNSLGLVGIGVEACGAEYAPSQVEINLTYRDALASVDDHIFFRYAVKQIAARHGWLATFMAKPFGDLSGSGLHVHQSLWREDANLFWDPARAGLSTLGEQYVAGLLHFAAETYLVGAPTPNAYKRISEHSFAPTNISWSGDNRCAAVRVLARGGGSSRVELRTAAADANPYLVAACAISAGLAGIEKALGLPPASHGDAYIAGTAEALPGSSAEALRRFQDSPFAREVLGDTAFRLMAALARQEAALCASHVSDWERERYAQAV